MHWHLVYRGVRCRYQRQSPDKTWERYDPQNIGQRKLVPCELKHDHPCSGSTLNYWSR